MNSTITAMRNSSSFHSSSKNSRQTFQKFDGDSYNAMYAADYNLNPDQKRDTLRGYSKAIGKSEHIDPYQNLKGFVLRILKAGWLEKSSYIVFRTNTFNPNESEILVEVTPYGYNLHGHAKFNFELINKLDEIYLLRSNGGDYIEVLKKYQQTPTVRTNEKSLFSFEQVFKNEEELKQHCVKLLNDYKFPRLRVEGFFKSYRMKFEKALENPAGKDISNSLSEELSKKFRVNSSK